MTKVITTIVLVASALLCFAAMVNAAISNPSFETDSSWTTSVVDSDGKYSASYTESWASEGSRSFLFQRGTGAVTAGNYAQISQVVDLSGVTKFTFDCQDTGIDFVPLRFLVDDTVVGTWTNNGWPNGQGSGWGNTATTLGIQVTLDTAYVGSHEFKVQMWNDTTHYPADPKSYRVDNLRMEVVPEPSSLLALMTGVIGLYGLMVRKRK